MTPKQMLDPVRHHFSGSADLTQIKVYKGEWVGLLVERPGKPFNEERHYIEVSVDHDGTVHIRASAGTPAIEHWPEPAEDTDA